MELKTYIAIFGTVILLFSHTNQILVAQQNSEKHNPEVWYMGMNDPYKPMLFMKSVGVGDTVLVLHGGFGGEHSSLQNLVEPHTNDYHFVLFDQRGSLRSPAADSLLTYQHLVEDIEWIRQELKVEKLTLLGYSMGTRLAMSYADAYPGHVKNLVLVSAVDPALRIPEGITDMSQLPPQISNMAADYLRSRPEVQKELRENNIDAVNLNQLTYKQRSDYWRINHASANIYDVTKWRQVTGGMTLFNARSMRLLGGSMPAPFDYTNSLREADIPITVINGDHDFGNFDVLSYEELYLKVIDSKAVDIPENIFPTWSDYKAELPRLEVYSIEKAGHNPWIDQPGEVKKLLQQALIRK
jgi:proline iminopeptidase